MVNCEATESSKVRTTNLSGIGSSALAFVALKSANMRIARMRVNLFMAQKNRAQASAACSKLSRDSGFRGGLLLRFGRDFLAFDPGLAAFAFLGFVMLLSHISLLCGIDSVVYQAAI
jgi:hypothetical protein